MPRHIQCERLAFAKWQFCLYIGNFGRLSHNCCLAKFTRMMQFLDSVARATYFARFPARNHLHERP